MNVKSKENQENSAVELVIEVGAEEFEAAVDKVYRKNRKNIAVPGFRKGHATRKIIEGMYGSGVFYQDAIDELYPNAYAQAVEQEGLDPVAYPKVEILEVGKDGFTFKALVTVRPPFEIGNYKGLTASKEEVEITPEDVENELKPYVQRATRLVNVEREAKEGDTVLIDFEGFKDGVPFEGGKGENHALELGSHSFIPGFEESVVGMKPGDEKDLDVTFPEDYTPELAGKPVVFKVKVHEVKEPQAPVVDDEFAKDVSEFDTLEEFKKDLETKLRERREHAAQHAFEDAITDALIGELKVELPQAKAAAKHQIKIEMALDAVAAAENMTITDEELEAEYKALAEQYGMDVEQVKAAAAPEDVKATLLRRKAMELVKAEAKAEKPKKTAKKKAAKEEEPATEGEAAPKKRTTRAKKGTPDKTEEPTE